MGNKDQILKIRIPYDNLSLEIAKHDQFLGKHNLYDILKFEMNNVGKEFWNVTIPIRRSWRIGKTLQVSSQVGLR